MTPDQQQPPPPSKPVRKLVIEVADARDLLPKDGLGSSSAYVVADFDGQKKRTSTISRSLNPVWNETLEFIVSDPSTMEYEELEIEVFNDKRMSNGSARKNHFLGRVKLYGTQFAKRENAGLIYFQLEKKSVFSWIRGEIGLRIYYYDDFVEINSDQVHENAPPPESIQQPQQQMEERKVDEVRVIENQNPNPNPTEIPIPIPVQVPVHVQSQGQGSIPQDNLPPPPIGGEQDPVEMENHYHTHNHQNPNQHQGIPPPEYPQEMRRMQGRVGVGSERVRVLKQRPGEYSPRVIPRRSTNAELGSERIPAYDLVEPMQYLFVRIVKARGLAHNESPYVRIGNSVRSKPGIPKPGEPSSNPEWHQVFALAYNKPESGNSSTLEISVWDAQSENFLGGVCFDLSDVPVRDPPDSPLAPQWYRLEGGDDPNAAGKVTGDIQLSVWIGTQADDAFPESWSSDAPYVSHTRSKVYQSPKLWYLRVTVMEAQDLEIAPNLPPLTAPDVRVKAQLGFQSVRTRRGVMNNRTSSFYWHEDLVFVAGEPLEDSLILLLEDRTGPDPVLLGHVLIPVAAIEQRIDERHVASRWLPLEGGPGGSYCGRIHLRMCLEGGYHVLDEAAHVCSDFRPTATQLWKPAIGILELGILGARGLLPMKSRGVGKGSTDPYCVAKYGKKWVRTRTVTDSFDPRWNEQYTWQVYDPCTVLTIGVFDNWRMFADMAEEKPDFRIGKVRIRVSTLESNKVYTNSYPLLVLQRTGLKKMGEIELAVRFACPSLLPDTCAVYGQPLLPRMHYLRPLGVAQQEALRGAATKMVAAWLARSEPPLGAEVVRYMLDADSHTWSMRKSKANWFRIVGVLAWAVGLAKWLDNIRRWRNPVTTVLVHLLYLVLVWYPDLIVPTAFLYVCLIGTWYYRFRPKSPAGMDIRLSQAESVDPEDLDEEFDTFPSSRPPELIRARYDRLRMLAARVQTVLGDFATQGERVQALVSWRDPRATKLFIGVCLMITVVLYVVPPKMAAVALGFYFLRHPMFREPMPPASVNFFRRLPSLSDRLM
ncbi:putative C2 domain, phosphoribosyltransferase, C2 domain superfamily [Helianthus annuus]|uniref:C2 domain, phosphoribosyltransferase, C2 domain superfamily n=1 Tax=Helianthus annuus TaxID=4232 RepID=A0A251RWT7_HELAN|nr:protein QUIRKY [Helianthus annuus]KAF5758487.1 putative C2 domain, phosphoribosyltransferase, C2 domain superfamily [Helianthus annuus]KAJ0459127.1 putative C2 domain, phosphoribosyltransferase, C2 domain superfamily [Helianthus annuus]KAJ0639682.1 putative C2 domain, phosphoribosyltransferase, C2 domain superfamily [Helianthus annuus]